MLLLIEEFKVFTKENINSIANIQKFFKNKN